ncbi:MAG: hypothetical protein WC455_03145 [Dehalococcoidia bacterium]|jgi:hypothetical protein
MRIAGSIITAICGIVVIVAIFLAWYDLGSWGYGTVSAWDGIKESISVDGALDVFLVFLGGILMAVFAIPVFIVSLASKGGRAAIVTLSIFAIVGALLAIGGSAWFFIDTAQNDGFSYISYGAWIAIAGAIVGLIFAILTASFSKGKQDW